MPHNFSKVDWVAMETLRQLKHRLIVAGFFRTDHEEDFKREFAVGDTVRVKYPWRPIVTDGLTYQPQNIERIETTVKVDRVKGVHFDYGTIEKLLDMERGEERVKKEYIQPATKYLASAYDVAAAEYAYKQTAAVVGVLGTNPTTFDATSAAARQRLQEMDCPDGDRALIVPPAVMRSIKTSTNMALFHPAEEIKRLFKTGIVGQADDFEWYESMSLKSHTAGNWQGGVTLASAAANGATSLSLTCTTGDTFKEGDVIGIGNVYPVNPVTRERTQSASTYTVVVAADVTGAASAATVTIRQAIYFSGNYQNVDAQPAAGATLTLFPGTTTPSGKSGKQGLALHPDAFAFVSLPLPMPKNEEIQSQTTDPDTGLSIAFIRSFDAIERRWINRFDAMFGFGRLHVESCATRVLCA